MVRIGIFGGFLSVLAVAALAHSGVKNPAVMARMEGMKSMGAAVKVLGEMAKGAAVFDADAAAMALQSLSTEAKRTRALFEANEGDPKSEALPLIWSDFADFEAKSEMLEAALAAQISNVETAADLGPILKAIGTQCSACHKTYRK